MNYEWQRMFVGRDTELGWLREAWYKAKQGDPQFNDSLSARQQLGPKWQEIVATGVPNTCT